MMTSRIWKKPRLALRGHFKSAIGGRHSGKPGRWTRLPYASRCPPTRPGLPPCLPPIALIKIPLRANLCFFQPLLPTRPGLPQRRPPFALMTPKS